MPPSNCDLTSRPIPSAARRRRGLSRMSGQEWSRFAGYSAHWLTRCVCPKVSLREVDSARSEVQLTRFLQ